MTIKALPAMETTFTVSAKGETSDQPFEGAFSYKRPNLRMRSEIAKTKALLDGGIKTLDEDTQMLHIILATLKHCLTKCPAWWEQSDFGFELYDLNVVFEVYKACNAFELKWKEQVYEGKPDADAKA